MPAGRHNFRVRKGETWTRVVTPQIGGAAVSLSGYAVRMHVRRTVTSASTVIELTTTNSRVTLAANDFTLVLTATETAALPEFAGDSAEYVYDLEIESGSGTVTPVLAGKFIVEQAVTR